MALILLTHTKREITMKKVLITGAGTGFGHEVAMRLAEKGYRHTYLSGKPTRVGGQCAQTGRPGFATVSWRNHRSRTPTVRRRYSWVMSDDCTLPFSFLTVCRLLSHEPTTPACVRHFWSIGPAGKSSASQALGFFKAAFHNRPQQIGCIGKCTPDLALK
jgi:short chain dehydrogenase.